MSGQKWSNDMSGQKWSNDTSDRKVWKEEVNDNVSDVAESARENGQILLDHVEMLERQVSETMFGVPNGREMQVCASVCAVFGMYVCMYVCIRCGRECERKWSNFAGSCDSAGAAGV